MSSLGHWSHADVEWEGSDSPEVELIEIGDDEVLCAFVVQGVRPGSKDAANRHWLEVVLPPAVTAMQKFIRNHHGD